jgi:hypothetical protein
LVSILDKDSWQLVTTICDEGDGLIHDMHS